MSKTFHILLSKKVNENFGIGRESNSTLRFVVRTEADKISTVVINAEEKGFTVEDISLTPVTALDVDVE